MPARCAIVVLLCLTSNVFPPVAAAQVPANWTKRVAPRQILGPVYYVGSEELSSFLITSREGHILVDSGDERYADAIADGIRALGFDIKDVKMLLTTQAHLDHVGAHARLKELSGARVLASAADAPVIEGGGKGDHILGPAYAFPPVKVDGIIKDGDVVRLGEIALTARLTPGHTRGSTTWTMKVRDAAGQERALSIIASTSVLDGVDLLNNDRYPTVTADFERTFRVLESLPCEVFLAPHVSMFGGLDKKSFIDPVGCREYIAASKREFEAKLSAQRAAARKPTSHP